MNLKNVGIFADGVAVAQVGKEPFRLARKVIDEIVLADVDQICAAVKDLFEDTRAVAEPSGALSVAGMKNYIDEKKISGKSLDYICISFYFYILKNKLFLAFYFRDHSRILLAWLEMVF